MKAAERRVVFRMKANDIQAAQAEKPAPSAHDSLGKFEEMAGKATGCSGMVGEGTARQAKNN